MDKESKILIKILLGFVNEKQIVDFPDIDWKKLYYLSYINSVSPIVYLMTKKYVSEGLVDEMIANRLASDFKGAVVRSTWQDCSMEKVIEYFNREQIMHVLLKGYQLKQLYSVPEVRLMGDVDLLIEEKDRMRVHQILLSMGYKNVSDVGPVWNYQNENLLIEVHTKLAYGKYWNNCNCEAYFEGAMNHLENTPYTYSKHLDVDYHFIFLMFHLAKHFYSFGAGIRFFVDIAIYIKKLSNEMNWKYIEEELTKLNLLKFSTIVLSLCKMWFLIETPLDDIELDKSFVNKLEEYIVSGGVFGKTKRDTSVLMLRKGSVESGESKILVKSRTVIHYLFPEKEYMRQYLPCIENKKWLLPIAWIKRWYEGLFKRRENSVKNIRGIHDANLELALEQKSILEKMGLN